MNQTTDIPQIQSDKNYDTIIIGSGAGGLCAAICLAREGQKVLVLEQHDVPGGWCHSFYIKGFRFTPGVHYIGLVNVGESTNELYVGLGIANDLAFYRQNTDAFEHCRIGEHRFDFPADHQALIQRLGDRFPKEKKGIEKYLKMVKTVSQQLQLIPKMNGFWDNITIPWRTKYLGKYGLFSLKRVVGWFVKDPLLKQILTIQWGDHGVSPSRASFPLHCAVMDHYFSGGFYPIGGGGALVKAMTKKIKAHGGDIKTSASVKRIIVKDTENGKKVTGVELANGEQLNATRVISNADPTVTYKQLIGQENLSKKLNAKLDKTKYSCTSLMLFLVVDMDVRKAGLDSGNVWAMPEISDEELEEQLNESDLLKNDFFTGLFVSCTTLKDPISFDGKHHTIEAITYINHDSFAAFENEKDNRSAAYLEFKEQLTQKMIRSVEKVVPDIKKHIVHQELGTPKTNEHYINSTKGSVYGTEKTLNQIGPLSFGLKSEIENLYLCGASILSHGVAGASYSGVQTAAHILGKRQEDLIQPDENQKLRIYDAEDSSDYPEWMLQKMKVKQDRLKALTD